MSLVSHYFTRTSNVPSVSPPNSPKCLPSNVIYPKFIQQLSLQITALGDGEVTVSKTQPPLSSILQSKEINTQLEQKLHSSDSC